MYTRELVSPVNGFLVLVVIYIDNRASFSPGHAAQLIFLSKNSELIIS